MSRARDLSKLANPSVFSVDTSNNIGINSTSPDAKLDVVGVVSAVTYYGDGSNLTGVANTDFIVGTAITMTTGNFTGNVTIGGTLTYEDVKNVDSVGVITARQGIRVGAGESIGSTTSAETVVYYGDGSKLTGIAAGGDTLDITSSLFA